MNIFKLRSLQTKIVVWGSLCLLTASVVIIAFAATTLYNTAIEAAKESVAATAKSEAGYIEAELEIALNAARTMAQMLTVATQSHVTLSRNDVNAMLRQVMIDNPQFLGTYTVWEPDAFDGKDAEYINAKGHDETGRFIPYWNRSADGNFALEACMGYEEDGIGDYYLLPKRTVKEVIIEPFVYPVQGEDVLMTSLVVPIAVGDQFKGIAGVDIRLDFLQELTDKIDLYNNTGMMMIITNNGTFAGVTGQPNWTNQGVQTYYKDWNDDLLFIQNAQTTIKDDTDRLVVFVPIRIGKTETPWFISLSVPYDAITANAASVTAQLIAIGLSMILFSLAGLWFTARQIALPIKAVTRAARHIAAGDLTPKVQITSNDETGVLAQVFNQMVDQLGDILGALKESQEMYRALVENSPDIIMRFDNQGRHLFINQSIERIVNRQAGEFTSKTHRELGFSEKQADFWEHSIQHVFETGEPFETEFEFEGLKGMIAFNLRLIPEFEKEHVKSVLSVSRDITERRRMEEEREFLMAQMQEQAQRIQQIIDTVPEGVFLLDALRCVILANPVAKRDLALLADAKVGDVLAYLSNRPLDEFLTSPPKGLWHEVEIDGVTPQHFEVIARPIETGPTQGGWVLVLRDVTREREIQQYAQQQNRLAAVGQLAAGIAHDFNNIMAVITLYAQIVEKIADLPLKAQDRLETITKQARRATHLIEQILDFSRQSMMERHPLDLMLFVKEQVKLLKRTLPEHINIQLIYSTHEYVVNADPTRIQQVIMNLAVNARDAMPDGGELRIEIEQRQIQGDSGPLPGMPPGDWVRLTVSDTGTGIPSEILPRIFDPFFTTKAPLGTGLGLAQVYGIIKQHDGYIDVDSQVGQGTTFALYFPALSAPTGDVQSARPQALIEGDGQTILVVEDDAATREALVDSLELMGYRTLAAENGQEALTILAQRPGEIALVLSDVVMPEMGGVALFHALRERDAAVKMALLTGHLLEDQLGDQLERLKAQGLVGWLQKPAGLDELARFIAQALGEDDGGQ